MENIVVGINHEELSNLCLEIIDYADDTSEIFDKMNNCIDKLSSYCDGDHINKIMSNYRQLSVYFPIIKDNIVSYSDDLIALIKKMQENDKYLSTLFQNYSDEIVSKTRSIES